MFSLSGQNRTKKLPHESSPIIEAQRRLLFWGGTPMNECCLFLRGLAWVLASPVRVEQEMRNAKLNNGLGAVGRKGKRDFFKKKGFSATSRRLPTFFLTKRSFQKKKKCELLTGVRGVRINNTASRNCQGGPSLRGKREVHFLVHLELDPFTCFGECNPNPASPSPPLLIPGTRCILLLS